MPTTTDIFQKRYGASDEMTPQVLNATLEVLLKHRSVRAYTQERLPPGTLEALVAAAQSASSSSNLQAWSVIAVEDPARKDRLAQLAGNQKHIRTCPLFLVWLADLARLERIAQARGLAHAGLDYTELFVLGVVDAALAAQNAAIAAESLGLGLVYIGAMRNYPLEVAVELNLPARTFAVFGMCVGWPDPERPTDVKPRLPQAAVLHRETYSTAPEPDAIAHYNQAMQQFYEEQRMQVTGDWSEHSASRVAGPESLSGRHVLLEALRSLGFKLQ